MLLPVQMDTYLFSGRLKSPPELAPVDRQYSLHPFPQGHLRNGFLYVGGYQCVM